MKRKSVILALMSDWRAVVFSLVIIGACFAYANLVLRALCFLVSLFLAIMAFCFFEHAVIFRDEWQTATSGKRRTPPGQSIIAGSLFLLLAIASMIYCFHH
jgi:hypothetical protein